MEYLIGLFVHKVEIHYEQYPQYFFFKTALYRHTSSFYELFLAKGKIMFSTELIGILFLDCIYKSTSHHL